MARAPQNAAVNLLKQPSPSRAETTSPSMTVLPASGLRPALVRQRNCGGVSMACDEQDRVRHGAVDQFGEPARARYRAECKLQYGDLKILANCITILSHPDRRGFQCGQPPDLLDTFPNAPLVGPVGAPFSMRSVLGTRRSTIAPAGRARAVMGSNRFMPLPPPTRRGTLRPRNR